ncbi:MAG: spore maturation protein [Lachnospiraceae bacterium]
MILIEYISSAIIPLVVGYIVALGIVRKVPVYECFVDGAKDGMSIVVKILPTLIGLMIGVGVLRSSGLLEQLTEWMKVPASFLKFPAELIPTALVRMFSSSAATSLLLDLYETYGTDSMIGLAASIMMSSTETIFYTMSVYFMTAKVTKTRWTLAGALISTLMGMIASVSLAHFMLT